MADPVLLDNRGVAGGPAQPVAVMNPASRGTAGTPSADVTTVQGVTGGTPVPVSMAAPATGGATSAKQDTGNASLATIAAGTPPLGATTSANSVPVTLSTDGAFSTNFGATTDAAAISDTGTASHISLLKRLLSVKFALGQALKAASLAVAPASDWTVPAAEVRTATLQSAAGAPGNGTAIDVSGMATLVLGIVISATATVTVEASFDATSAADGTWFTLTTGQNLASGALISGISSSTINARYGVTGVKMVRARVSAWTSGTVTVAGRAQANEGPLPQTNVAIYAAGTTSNAAVATAADTAALAVGLTVNAQTKVSNGASTDLLRTPNIFKTATATASGDTALWTPTAGKKFRVMGYSIEISGEATLAGAADLVVTLRDATTDLLLTHSVYVPAAAPAAPGGTVLSKTVQLGNGKLSALANNVCNVNLSAALTAGTCRVSVFGTEE